MSKIEKTISVLQQMQQTAETPGSLHPLCILAITVVYLVAMLSVPPDALAMLLWFAIYPIVMSAVIGRSFSRIFAGSLVALPFALLIGLFNPVYDTRIMFTIGGVAISHGWVSYISIIVRSMLSVQALLILIWSGGFIGMCRSLESVGVPAFLTTQLMMVYRYLTVLLQESLDMTRARRARGYGRRHLDLRMWGAFCGQLFLRTVNRSEAIHRAMLARGFTGRLPHYRSGRRRCSRTDTLALLLCCAVFAAMRLVNLSMIFQHC